MNKYLRAVSANFIFFVISAIFFLIITPIAIKVMGEEFYGLWVVLIALMLFLNVGTLGMVAIVTKFSAEEPAQDGARMQGNRVMTAGYIVVFSMSIVTAVILLLARNMIADNINTSVGFREQVRVALFWIAASIFPQFLASVPNGYLISQLRNRMVRQIELFSSILLWLGATLLTLIGKNLVSLAAWCFFSNLLAFGLYIWAINQVERFHFQPDTSTLRKMLNFSGYMFLESMAITSFQQFDKVIVSFTLGPAIAGVYSVGTSLALRLTIVTGQATEVMIPYASLKDSLGEKLKLFSTFRWLSRYVSLALAIMSSFLIIWMNEILTVWISPDYAAHYTVAFRVLIMAYSLLSLCRPAHQALTGMGKVKFTAILYLFSSVLMLTGVFFLSRKFGLIGAAVSNLVMIILLVYNLFVYTTFQSPICWRDVLNDLQLGFLLPIFIFVVNLFSVTLILKSLESIALGIFFTVLVMRDSFVKACFLNLKRSLFKT